ncbi:hypothetical protein J4E91_002782 [Alternaria rosae]|nr:hypothetical protein J4E91_002782 [Alternaria rosae]
MKLLTNNLGVVLCSAVAVTAQTSNEQQASTIEAPETQPSGHVSEGKATIRCARECVGLFSYETEEEWYMAMECLETCELAKEAEVYLEDYGLSSARVVPLNIASDMGKFQKTHDEDRSRFYPWNAKEPSGGASCVDGGLK